MAPLVERIEIARPPDEVFAYMTDPAHLTEWQESLVSARMEGGAAPAVGARMTAVRKVGGRERTMTSELTEYDPPRRFRFRGIDGPVRAFGSGSVEPLEGGTSSRVTIELDFEGHGIGKLLVPLVVRPQARKELPKNQQNLKRHLEGGAG
jgi:uncharacterized protein YndB with AHSA1/START domain